MDLMAALISFQRANLDHFGGVWLDFCDESMVRFSISGIIIHNINLSETFGFELNGLPQTHKVALRGSFDHAIASSYLVRFNIFETGVITRFNIFEIGVIATMD